MSDKQTAPILPPLGGGGGNNGENNGGAPQQQTVSLQQVFATAQGLNVLTTGSGSQFVITSQVPGLAQVIPGNVTTNSSLQQVGVTRIVNITNATPRVSVVGVAGASGSPLTSPTRHTPTKLVLATSPKLVRTSIGNMFVTPSSQASMHSPPAKKRLKLTETMEKPTSFSDDAMGYRRRIMEHKMKRMRAIREKYAENASELFFLHAGGNMMDFQTWRKKPPTPQYLHFLRQHRLDPDDDDEDLTIPLPPSVSEIPSTTATVTCSSTIVPLNQGTEVKISGIGVTPVAVSTTLPAAVAQLSQQGGTPIVPDPSKLISSTIATSLSVDKISLSTSSALSSSSSSSSSLSSSSSSTVTTCVKTPTPAPPPGLVNPQPIVKLVKLPASTISSSCDTTNNQEQIVEKAKQEAYVMQRIAELQREGLWSERRLPKVQEPSRTKAHWDYLLEEMVWLAADFAQERKWKKAAAKKCARMVQKHFQEKAIQAQKAEKSQELRLKKIAGFVAKEIKTFWTNVEKLVEYKQQTRLEEKRKKALDQHLNFIVGQTEKYSTWLTEGLNKADGSQSIPASMNSSRISSPITTGKSHSDEEFQPNQSSDDDEETIAKAEEEMKSTTNHKEEVELLKKESEIPLEDLLRDLPPDYLENRNKSLSPVSKEVEEEEVDNEKSEKDTDFVAASDESSDEEDTIMEQEKIEGNQDHKQELDDLRAENEMSIDELMTKYGNMSDPPMDTDDNTGKEFDKEEIHEDGATSSDSESEESDNEEDDDDDDDDDADASSQSQSDAETDIGLKSLLEDPCNDKSVEEKSMEVDRTEEHNEMDDVAALAESIQPKGNTLLTTSVVTKIPFLLKHSLREYQHIGLDWLVTMYERKLNGILADEMGLGKTIQTIALLAHLACEKGNWGPHLIIVPTSVMLNWEMECKKWCPGFKILTYYGTQKERKQKRTGWTKPNAFHICITSYKLVIQDHQSFRRKKWKYLILDEAQNIKNFKSQRWQLLLNFQTQRRLLLTGTPLQNNLMELWSLMHFLMPNVFQSHREFKEWFSNPVTGMIEGNSEYNENIIRRLHKVLRPFLLRRLKTEVEKQLPKKYEHVIMCRLSKRQRYLYDDFMSRAKTKETLASGNLLSVINVLMQLRKVCNHPNLFEVRPTVSPFQMEAIEFVTASLAWSALDYDPFKHIDLSCLNLLLVKLELTLTAFVAHRVRRLQTPKKLIEEIDSQPEPPPRCPSGKIKINVRLSNQVKPSSQPQQTQTKLKNLAGILPTPRVGTSPLIKTLNNQNNSAQGVTLRVAGGQQLQGYSVQLVQHQGSVKAIPVATLPHNPQSTTVTPTTAAMNAQRITVGNTNIRDGLQRLATQTVTVKQGDSVQRIAVPSFAQLVQTSTGRHIILTSTPQNTSTVSFPVMTPSGQRLTVVSKPLMGISTSATTVNKVLGGVVTTTSGTSGRPVMRVPPLNVTTSPTQSNSVNTIQNQQQTVRCGIVTRHTQKESEKILTKENPKSEFYIPHLDEERRQRRQNKLRMIANINEKRCAACPLYGEDLFTALRIGKPSTACPWHSGWMYCDSVREQSVRTRRQFFSRTEALAEAIKNTERIVEEFKETFERFVVYVPAVRAPIPRFHVSHPPPHKLWAQRRAELELTQQVLPKLALFHPIAGAMMTQFPDPRLIQYDCGKLQSLDRLLRKLKSGNHRVLIFTQMTRMLDVLEAFLNFHGHIYLRLDGATRVDQRQVLMERFNADKRIFCFILSTRSGGVGVNLTGADTVIFYDSDWNPTMDAQAQDRCHRIGQTRDVHIYRLVSEKTVEENILKKANQKRLLGDLAIEGGNFTTAYFKSSTIQDLFNVDQSENDASTRMAEVLEQNKDREKHLQRDFVSTPSQPAEDKVAMGALESALAAAEEDLDVQAAKTAKAEAVADLAEFDENIPLDEADKEDTQISKAEQEVQNLVSQLTPIERYAMKFVEDSEGAFSAAQLAAAERELEEQKKEWELDRLRALREEEERRMRMADDDDDRPLTFAREDAQNQVNSNSNSKKVVTSKKVQPSRRSSRRFNMSSRSARKSSESETETTTDSDSESQEDVVEDSADEESSYTESQSQGDEDEEEEDEEEEEEEGEEEDEERGGNDPNDSEGKGSHPRRRNRSSKSFNQNHFDLNSPRTRSRGNVKINLWTLDVSPILPGMKGKCRGRYSNRRNKSDNSESEEFTLPLPPDAASKKLVNSSVTLLINKLENEQTFIDNSEELVLSSKSLNNSDENLNSTESSVTDDDTNQQISMTSTNTETNSDVRESEINSCTSSNLTQQQVITSIDESNDVPSSSSQNEIEYPNSSNKTNNENQNDDSANSDATRLPQKISSQNDFDNSTNSSNRKTDENKNEGSNFIQKPTNSYCTRSAQNVITKIEAEDFDLPDSKDDDSNSTANSSATQLTQTSNTNNDAEDLDSHSKKNDENRNDASNSIANSTNFYATRSTQKFAIQNDVEDVNINKKSDENKHDGSNSNPMNNPYPTRSTQKPVTQNDAEESNSSNKKSNENKTEGSNSVMNQVSNSTYATRSNQKFITEDSSNENSGKVNIRLRSRKSASPVLESRNSPSSHDTVDKNCKNSLDKSKNKLNSMLGLKFDVDTSPTVVLEALETLDTKNIAFLRTSSPILDSKLIKKQRLQLRRSSSPIFTVQSERIETRESSPIFPRRRKNSTRRSLHKSESESMSKKTDCCTESLSSNDSKRSINVSSECISQVTPVTRTHSSQKCKEIHNSNESLDKSKNESSCNDNNDSSSKSRTKCETAEISMIVSGVTTRSSKHNNCNKQCVAENVDNKTVKIVESEASEHKIEKRNTRRIQEDTESFSSQNQNVSKVVSSKLGVHKVESMTEQGRIRCTRSSAISSLETQSSEIDSSADRKNSKKNQNEVDSGELNHNQVTSSSKTGTDNNTQSQKLDSLLVNEQGRITRSNSIVSMEIQPVETTNSVSSDKRSTKKDQEAVESTECNHQSQVTSTNKTFEHARITRSCMIVVSQSTLDVDSMGDKRSTKKVQDEINGGESNISNVSKPAKLTPTTTITKSDSSEQSQIGRITRSSITMPPPQETPRTTLFKRRPDTPFPEEITSSHISTRPITRSAASSINNLSPANEETFIKPPTRSNNNGNDNLKFQLDNGFLCPVAIRKKSTNKSSSDIESSNSNNVGNKLKKASETMNNTVPRQRRPDTPMPMFDSSPRVTRSASCFATNLKSSSILRLENTINNLNSNDTGEDITTDGSQQNSHTNDQSANQKPQRTAKVVAILTLDSHSKNHAKSSHNAETSKNSKELKSGNNENSSTSSLSSDKLDKIDKINLRSNIDHNTGKVSMKSTMIALVDLENEPDYQGSERKSKKRIRKTRIAPFGKPLIGNKSNETPLIDLLDDSDEQTPPPHKRSFRSQQPLPPPPNSLSKNQSEKSNSNSS